MDLVITAAMPATPSLSLEGQAEYFKDESAVNEEVQDRVLDGCGRGKHSTLVTKLISYGTSAVKEESLFEANEPGAGCRGGGREVEVTSDKPQKIGLQSVLVEHVA